MMTCLKDISRSFRIAGCIIVMQAADQAPQVAPRTPSSALRRRFADADENDAPTPLRKPLRIPTPARWDLHLVRKSALRVCRETSLTAMEKGPCMVFEMCSANRSAGVRELPLCTWVVCPPYRLQAGRKSHDLDHVCVELPYPRSQQHADKSSDEERCHGWVGVQGQASCGQT